MMSLAKTGFDEKEYTTLTEEIETLRERKQRLKDAEAARARRDKQGEAFKAYLTAQDTLLDRFDGDLFRRLVEKVKVLSMVEAVFVFKTGVEVREIL